MKQLTFAVLNSVTDVLYQVQDLRDIGKLSELSCRLLQMFYVTGWDDGFIQLRRRDLCAALGASKAELDRPALSGTAEICWWQ